MPKPSIIILHVTFHLLNTYAQLLILTKNTLRSLAYGEFSMIKFYIFFFLFKLLNLTKVARDFSSQTFRKKTKYDDNDGDISEIFHQFLTLNSTTDLDSIHVSFV